MLARFIIVKHGGWELDAKHVYPGMSKPNYAHGFLVILARGERKANAGVVDNLFMPQDLFDFGISIFHHFFCHGILLLIRDWPVITGGGNHAKTDA